MREIILDAPNLGELERKRVDECLDSTFVSTVGSYVPEFEKKFSEYNNSGFAVSTQSGTAAIHMALYELGIGKGDEVIAPSLTFIASINPILYTGATPVFVDVDEKTWNIDPEKIEEAITAKTKAILVVHLYGNPCDMNRIKEISEKYGIPIIEDAAESLGATYGGIKTGNFGVMGCFSFNGNKVITTAGGGMVTVQSQEKAKHLKFLVNQARDEKLGYYHPEMGFNYRMTNICASLGLAQMDRLDGFLQMKREFHDVYYSILNKSDNIDFQQEYENSKSSFWLTSIVLKESNNNIVTLQAKLKNKGIPTRRMFFPVVEFPYLKEYKKGEYPNAYKIFNNGLNLPGSTLNSVENIHYVADEIKNIIG